jgi:uncharacterized repeat protein (TIGR02543 family)
VAKFDARPPHGLTVGVIRRRGATGHVTSDPPGIRCGTDCRASYPHGTPVTLAATPTAGSTFVGWTGACTHTRPRCSLAMTGPKAATATFAK